MSLPFRTIHYYAELGQRSVFPTSEVPEHFVGQVTVLKYFSHYMEENLMDVSCLVSLPPFLLHAVACYHSNVLTPLLSQGGDLGSMTDANMPRLYLLQWLKSDRALMMLFNDGTFQVNTFTEIHLQQCLCQLQNRTMLTSRVLFLKVNFYHDHTKIILCCQRDEYMLTYINEDRVSKTFKLSSLLTSGCTTDLQERMLYSLNMLRCSILD